MEQFSTCNLYDLCGTTRKEFSLVSEIGYQSCEAFSVKRPMQRCGQVVSISRTSYSTCKGFCPVPSILDMKSFQT